MTTTLDFDYIKGPLIGEGRLSKVYLCARPNCADIYAVKEVVYQNLGEGTAASSLLAAFQTEANLLSRLSHRGLPKVLSVYNSPEIYTWHTVLELFDNGDLATMIAQYRLAGVRIPEERVLEIFGQLADTIAYLHEVYKADSSEIHQIVHKNLRSENVLLKLSGLVGIGAFRSAEEQALPHRHMACLEPSPYLAPEVLAGGSYGPPSDAWALGCIVAEMCLLERLFEQPVTPELAAARLPVNVTRLGYSKALEALINALLQRDVSVRASVFEIRSDPALAHARQAVFARE